MIRVCCAILGILMPSMTFADVVVPTRTIRAATIISEVDLALKPGQVANTFERFQDVVGQEARTTLYAGRPIRIDDIGPPALVDRNQIVSIRFQSGGLLIMTEGRSLQRGGVGDRIRIMNLNSRATLFGHIQSDGTVRVSH